MTAPSLRSIETPGSGHAFDLDDHHHFETGRPLRVCGNSFDMLAATRYAPHFRLSGDQSTHFGLFDCAPAGVSAAPANPASWWSLCHQNRR